MHDAVMVVGWTILWTITITILAVVIEDARHVYNQARMRKNEK